MLAKILYRLKQFYSGMFARYTKADEIFARGYLNIQEMSLFHQLHGFEKKHSVIVGRKMLEAAHRYPQLDQRKLVRLGLLHDIGKVLERNSILTKSILVIVRFFLPGLYDHLADRGKDHLFFRRFYIHKHHGREGANLLEKIGESAEVLSIIAKHDPRVDPLDKEPPLELRLLREADNCY